MPNQYSEDSRRVTYVEDRELFEHLEKIAKSQNVTVGELIRRATVEKYGKIAPIEGAETSVAARFAKVGESSAAVKAAAKKRAPRKSASPRNKKYQ